ncbi:hypothetical protein, partial [Planomonospora algeriensis]
MRRSLSWSRSAGRKAWMTAVLATVLTPGLLALQALPVTAVVSPAALTSNPVDTPDQLSGSAKDLPHLVDSEVTQSTATPTSDTSNKGKRPKDALPLEKRHEVTEEPATGGLKSPPPLPWAEPEPEKDASRQPAQGSRGEVRAQSTGLKRVSAPKVTPLAAPSWQVAAGAPIAGKSFTKSANTATGPSVAELGVDVGTQGTGLWTL